VSMMLFVLSAVVISAAIAAVAVVVLSADNPPSGDVCKRR
jgi:multisubunit Na+/H+ antiporter MnhC subunit